jgi:hypothetical protein
MVRLNAFCLSNREQVTGYSYAPPMRATLKAQTHQALFNTDLLSSYFPDVNIFHISGRGTCYYCMWAYMEVSRMYKEAILRGDKVRPITFKLVEEGNHFVSGVLFERIYHSRSRSFIMICPIYCYGRWSRVANSRERIRVVIRNHIVIYTLRCDSVSTAFILLSSGF